MEEKARNLRQLAGRNMLWHGDKLRSRLGWYGTRRLGNELRLLIDGLRRTLLLLLLGLLLRLRMLILDVDGTLIMHHVVVRIYLRSSPKKEHTS